MQKLTTLQHFVYGFINFRDCWWARFNINYANNQDFWEWLSTGYYDMYVYPYQDPYKQLEDKR